MKIQIVHVNDVSKDLAPRYLRQIAAWYYEAWGSITGQQQAEFETIINTSFQTGSAEYFVAVNTQTHELLGTISLKQRNMEDEYPDQQWGPWISGLYIREQDRHCGISAMLGKKVTETAYEKNISNVYYFTHNYDLLAFYNRLNGTLIKPLIGDSYFYRHKPILVYAAKPPDLLHLINEYLLKENIHYDVKNNVFSTQQPQEAASAQPLARL